MGYSPVAWATFGGSLAAIAGALTGLLFVALDGYLAWQKPSEAEPITEATTASREPIRTTSQIGHVVLVGHGRVMWLSRCRGLIRCLLWSDAGLARGFCDRLTVRVVSSDLGHCGAHVGRREEEVVDDGDLLRGAVGEANRDDGCVSDCVADQEFERWKVLV